MGARLCGGTNAVANRANQWPNCAAHLRAANAAANTGRQVGHESFLPSSASRGCNRDPLIYRFQTQATEGR